MIEGVYELADLTEAEEIFLTSASYGVAPVTTFDFRRYSLTAESACAKLAFGLKQLASES